MVKDKMLHQGRADSGTLRCVDSHPEGNEKNQTIYRRIVRYSPIIIEREPEDHGDNVQESSGKKHSGEFFSSESSIDKKKNNKTLVIVSKKSFPL